MKEESHRVSEVCEKSVDKTTHRTTPRRLNGHSLYNADDAAGPRDSEADHRPVRPAARQFRRRRPPAESGRRAPRLELAPGYYDTWCYLPLVATVTFNAEPMQHVVAALLRPGTGAATRGVRGLLRRLFTKLRALFPHARLRVRADAGFADAKLLAFLDAAEVEYVLGLAGNRRLDKRVRRLLGRARLLARTTGDTATLYGETRYAARRWDRKRRIIMKAEVLCYPGRSSKDNPRFLVTNLPHRPATVYRRLYCGRGDMENRLKELQQGLAMDRTSCSRFPANQLRLLFSIAAYVLFQALQSFARTTTLGSAQVWTLRERLLKIAVWVERSVRRIVLHSPQASPWRATWRDLAQALTAT